MSKALAMAPKFSKPNTLIKLRYMSYFTANADPTIEESSGKIDLLLNPNKAVQRILDKERTMEDIRDKQNIVQNIFLLKN